MVTAQKDNPVRLSDLVGSALPPGPDPALTDITQDSRSAAPGGAFLACRGRTTHGLAHLEVALQRGIAAVLWEPAEGVAAPALPRETVGVAVPGLAQRAGGLADRFFGAPSAAMQVVGFTGTNGKTTSAYLLAQAAEATGRASAYLGTIGHGRPGALTTGELTTPDAVTVHRRLAEARTAGCAVMSMEASSHALDQHRVEGVRFETAVFTNLTRDHLDYHGTLEAYGAAKERLFQWPGLHTAVVNVDDEFGRGLAARIGPRVRTIACSSRGPLAPCATGTHVCARSVRTSVAGLEMEIDGSFGRGVLRSRLVGRFNADNLLSVLGVLLGWNVSLEAALAALAECAAPPGRMETYGGGVQPLAIVDYAHTPDALAKLLAAARDHARGRLICVFGCGGDRDPGKRPIMGGIAERSADLVFVTSDNPRTEDPARIIEQVLAGIGERSRVRVVPERERAIHEAIIEADAGDVVVIAGKGHETYQIVGREVRPFSDRAVVLDALGAAA
jgi:UDP-N-acetylmuramoyl-L-alanyl-D-glutamate--2,6-diaminopimelate ligase